MLMGTHARTCKTSEAGGGVQQNLTVTYLGGREEAHPWDEDIGAGGDVFGLAPSTPPVRVGGERGPKAHVLVCAPSNSALDEIVLRLLSHGLLDRCGDAQTQEGQDADISLLRASHLKRLTIGSC